MLVKRVDSTGLSSIQTKTGTVEWNKALFADGLSYEYELLVRDQLLGLLLR